jgi:glycosyltransferase involved in cell wall biosynthesis
MVKQIQYRLQMSEENLTPLVSICCITYNQEKYIGKALESFLMQRTDFRFEIIVHDDASTDRTTKIVKEYERKFPNIIKPIYQSENKYSKEGLNFQYKHVFPHAVGKYIAFCEGDDFWIDPRKLQNQVDFLEQNSDYGLVHTRAVKYIDKLGAFAETIGRQQQNFQSLITENTISNLTVCLRNDLFKQYIEAVRPEQHISWTTCDFPIWLWLIQRTKFKFFEDITGVYRVIETSICHHQDDKKRLNFHEGINDILDYFLTDYGSDSLEKEIKAKYTSQMIKMVFLDRSWKGIIKAIKIFYFGKNWLDLFWIFITLPLIFSSFLIKCSYFVRHKLAL